MKNLQPHEDIEKLQEIVLWDRNHPMCLLNLLPEEIGNKIENTYKSNPDLFLMDEHSLNKELRSQNQQPTPTDNRLRLKFWMEFDRVHSLGLKTMNISNIVAGIISRDTFNLRYLQREEKVAWLVLPPANYAIKILEALEFGIEQLREILMEDHAPGGKLNVKLAGLKVAIVKMLDDRLNGMPTQNVNQKNLHLHAGPKQIQELTGLMTEEAINKRLAEAESRERASLHLPPVREVGPSEEG